MSQRNAWKLLAHLMILLALVGCASNNQLEGGTFLQDYRHLRPTDTTGAWVESHRELPLANYDRFIIARLLIQVRPDTDSPVSIHDVDRAEAAYREALTSALEQGGRFTRASAAGPGVLVIRTAVTSTYDESVRPAARVGKRTVAIESEAVDSLDSKRVVAVVDLQETASPGSGAAPDTISIFEPWSKRFRANLDAIQLAQTQKKKT